MCRLDFVFLSWFLVPSTIEYLKDHLKWENTHPFWVAMNMHDFI